MNITNRVQWSSEPEIKQACNNTPLYYVEGRDRRWPLAVRDPIICYSCDDVNCGRKTNLKLTASQLVSIPSVTIKTNLSMGFNELQCFPCACTHTELCPVIDWDVFVNIAARWTT